MTDFILTYTIPLVIVLIAVSDTTAGMLFRATIAVWPAWHGLITQDQFYAFAEWSLF